MLMQPLKIKEDGFHQNVLRVSELKLGWFSPVLLHQKRLIMTISADVLFFTIILWNMTQISSFFHCCYQKWFVHKSFDAIPTTRLLCCYLTLLSQSQLILFMFYYFFEVRWKQLRSWRKIFQHICVQMLHDHNSEKTTKIGTVYKVVAKAI